MGEHRGFRTETLSSDIALDITLRGTPRELAHSKDLDQTATSGTTGTCKSRNDLDEGLQSVEEEPKDKHQCMQNKNHVTNPASCRVGNR
jgi:hypothetical protein